MCARARSGAGGWRRQHRPVDGPTFRPRSIGICPECTRNWAQSQDRMTSAQCENEPSPFALIFPSCNYIYTFYFYLESCPERPQQVICPARPVQRPEPQSTLLTTLGRLVFRQNSVLLKNPEFVNDFCVHRKAEFDTGSPGHTHPATSQGPRRGSIPRQRPHASDHGFRQKREPARGSETHRGCFTDLHHWDRKLRGQQPGADAILGTAMPRPRLPFAGLRAARAGPRDVAGAWRGGHVARPALRTTHAPVEPRPQPHPAEARATLPRCKR